MNCYIVFLVVPYGLRNLPRDMVERPAEVNEILNLLMEGNNRVGVVGSRSGDVFGIRGMGGLGKTVLAQAVAWAASDSRQVIWFNIGQSPDCLALINILIKVLGGEAVSFSDICAAQAWVKANTVCISRRCTKHCLTGTTKYATFRNTCCIARLFFRKYDS